MLIIKQLFKYYIYMISIFLIGRVALFIIYFDKLSESDSSIWLSFIYGLRMDTIVTGILLAIPLIVLTLFPKVLKSFSEIFLKYYFLVVLASLIYIENATFPFIAQYDVRPNYLFVEYLEYPKEVFSMIFADYKLELSIALVMIGGFIYLYLKNVKDSVGEIFEISYLKRVALFIPILLVLFMGVRSSFGHRGANVSDAMYSSNRMLNEITKNSIHAIGYAIYINKKHGSGKLVKQYGKMDLQEAYSRVKSSLNIESIDKTSPLKD